MLVSDSGDTVLTKADSVLAPGAHSSVRESGTSLGGYNLGSPGCDGAHRGFWGVSGRVPGGDSPSPCGWRGALLVDLGTENRMLPLGGVW